MQWQLSSKCHSLTIATPCYLATMTFLVTQSPASLGSSSSRSSLMKVSGTFQLIQTFSKNQFISTHFPLCRELPIADSSVGKSFAIAKNSGGSSLSALAVGDFGDADFMDNVSLDDLGKPPVVDHVRE